MKELLLVGSIATILLLNGCTTYTFAQPNKTNREMQRAYAICNLEADKSTMYIHNGITRAFKAAELTNRCMVIEGYRKVKLTK